VGSYYSKGALLRLGLAEPWNGKKLAVTETPAVS
jgi:hypothetical protein